MRVNNNTVFSLASVLIMFIFKLTLAVISFSGVYGHVKTCNDCIQFSLCPNALERANKGASNETVQLFRSAFCGFEHIGQRRIPMVCCSEFSPQPMQSRNAIETHPNLRLLPEACGKIYGQRILGGPFAGMYEYPWMTLISYRKAVGVEFECGGSIISSRYILTAAHCVHKRIVAGVRIGEYDVRFTNDCQGENPYFFCESHVQDIGVQEIIIHSNYSIDTNMKNDIALLRLQKEIDFGFENAKPICLPISQELRQSLKDGERGAVAGWGVTGSRTESSVLRKSSIPLLTSESCTRFFDMSPTVQNNGVTENEFCAAELSKDSCNGDSGGPLMMARPHNGVDISVQYGIISREPRVCGYQTPVIYTDVTKYVDWILDNIKP